MLNKVNCFFTCEIKGRDISRPEKWADYCLKPSQYLFHGLKVDYIAFKGNVAVQLDDIYTHDERTWIKTAQMVVLFIPGVLTGGFLKLLTFFFRDSVDRTFVNDCLMLCKKGLLSKSKMVGGTQNVNVHWSENNTSEDFGKDISTLVSLLRVNGSMPSKCFFLSEIQHINLYIEHKQNIIANRLILRHIHLLWNLRSINFEDYYYVNNTGKEINYLESTTILAKRKLGYGYSEFVSFKDFLKDITDLHGKVAVETNR